MCFIGGGVWCDGAYTREKKENPLNPACLIFRLTQANILKCLNQDSGFPCFKGGPRTIQNLRKRFHLSLTEEVCKFRFYSSLSL